MKFRTNIIAFILLASLAMTAFSEAMESELIFPQQNKHVHAASIVECPNGDLLAAWFHGTGERTADDVQIQGARLRMNADAWSDIFIMADVPGFPDCNPVLYVDAQERLWLFWTLVLANRWENSLLKYVRASRYTADGPPQWDWQDVILVQPAGDFQKQLKSAFETLVPDEPMWAEYARPYAEMLIEAAEDKLKRQIGWMTRIHPTTLASGRILLPLYSDGFNVSLMAYSDDLGNHWSASAPIVGLGPIQPTAAQRKDGAVVAYFRDSGDPPGRIHRAESGDDGETWTLTQKTDLPNPGASIQVLVLADGRWLLIYNDTEEERNSLALAVSDDEGVSWSLRRHLEKAPIGEGSFSYPSLIQARNGRIHAVYSYKTAEGASIKHVSFSPDWLTGN